jgi:hypothetical protein
LKSWLNIVGSPLEIEQLADYVEGKLCGVKNGSGERCQTFISPWPHN